MISTLARLAPPGSAGRLAATASAGRLAGAALAGGLIAFALALWLGRAGVALAALDASWLFFAGLSTGSLAVTAAVRLAGGRWARPILPIAEAAAGFLVPSLALLAVLLAGARSLLPWTVAAGGGSLGLLALRQLAPSAALAWLGQRLVRGARAPEAADRRRQLEAAGYLLVYVVALSLWAYDWVLALTEGSPAAVVPAFYLVGAFLSGLAWIALVAAARGVAGPELRHDLGKLLFGFAALWAYLLWALYLATWYGNLPDEVEFLLRRWQGGYRLAAAAVLAAVFVGPFLLLLAERTKRRRWTLALGASTVLAGLLAERFLLVLPSLELAPTAGAALLVGAVALGVAGLFVLSLRRGAVRAVPGPR
jgi:Ni/Fe-hydrogenase subunit HybB-like protein